MKKISVIIPVYNVQKYLENCLDSVINQSYKNLEIILIDDGSTDNSLNIIKDYKEQDNRIKLITQKNSGVSAARNLGIENSSGEYIAFVDSDDWLELTMYEELINRIKDADAIVCNFVREYSNRSEKEVSPFKDEVTLDEEEIYSKWILDLISGEDERESYIMGTVWRALYKRNIILEKNISFNKNLSYAEDLVFNLEYFINCNRIKFYNEALYHYKFNTNSAVTKYDENLWIKNLKVNEVIYNIFFKEDFNIIKGEIADELRDRINSRLVSVAVGSIVNIFHEDNKDSFNVKYKKVKNILNNNSLLLVKKNYKIKNNKYKLLTTKLTMIPIGIINLNKIKRALLDKN